MATFDHHDPTRSAPDDEALRSRDSRELDAARDLSGRILALGRAHEHRKLLEIADDPLTDELLSRLPHSAQRSAAIQLDGARLWAERQLESNRRRLGEARQALNDYDLALARAISRRLETRFLGPDEIEARNALLLDIEAAAMDLEDLQESAELVVAESAPPKKPWWRRRR